jgi:hypothetical protein
MFGALPDRMAPLRVVDTCNLFLMSINSCYLLKTLRVIKYLQHAEAPCVQVELQTFLIRALDIGQLSLCPRRKCPRVRLDAVAKRNISPSVVNLTQVIQPLA